MNDDDIQISVLTKCEEPDIKERNIVNGLYGWHENVIDLWNSFVSSLWMALFRCLCVNSLLLECLVGYARLLVVGKR